MGSDLLQNAGLIAGIGGLLIAFVTGVFALVTKKLRSPADDREDQKLVIEGDKVRLEVGKSLMEQMKSMMELQATAHNKAISDLKSEHSRDLEQVRADVASLRGQLEEMTRERPLLIQIIHAVARIARKYGGAEAEAELRSITPPAKDVDLLRG